ncbi:hypothetical protein EBT16_12980 [bacterium]|nr:hypothetical protein [bacterium]
MVDGSEVGEVYTTFTLPGVEDIALAKEDSLLLLSVDDRAARREGKEGVHGIYLVDLREDSLQAISISSHLNFPFNPHGISVFYLDSARYGLMAIFCIGTEDDDGNAASLPEKKTGPTFKDTVKTPSKVVKGGFLQADEVQQIENLIGSDHELADRILAGYSQKYKEPIATFYDLRKSDYPALLTRISAMKNPKPIARQA